MKNSEKLGSGCGRKRQSVERTADGGEDPQSAVLHAQSAL